MYLNTAIRRAAGLPVSSRPRPQLPLVKAIWKAAS